MHSFFKGADKIPKLDKEGFGKLVTASLQSIQIATDDNAIEVSDSIVTACKRAARPRPAPTVPTEIK